MSVQIGESGTTQNTQKLNNKNKKTGSISSAGSTTKKGSTTIKGSAIGSFGSTGSTGSTGAAGSAGSTGKTLPKKLADVNAAYDKWKNSDAGKAGKRSGDLWDAYMKLRNNLTPEERSELDEYTEGENFGN